MARGITEKDVWTAADALLLDGHRPTVERVRHHIGRGSPNTVTPYLDTWFKGLGRRLLDPMAYTAAPTVPEPIAAAATHFWEVALATARQQVEQDVSEARRALDTQRLELDEEFDELSSEAAKLEASKAAMEETLALAKTQLAQAAQHLQAAEERATSLGGRCEALVQELHAVRESLEAERTAAGQQRQRVAAERAAELDRHTAAERRWLAELDQARTAARAATEALTVERRDWERQRQSGLERERASATEVAQSRAAAAAAGAELQVARDERDRAQAELAARDDALQLFRDRSQKTEQKLEAQLEEALRAMGRTWHGALKTEAPRARS